MSARLLHADGQRSYRNYFSAKLFRVHSEVMFPFFSSHLAVLMRTLRGVGERRPPDTATNSGHSETISRLYTVSFQLFLYL